MKYKLYNIDFYDILSKFNNRNFVRLILSDIPYNLTSMDWDVKLNLPKMWDIYQSLIINDGVIALHSSGKFTPILQCSNFEDYKYNYKWLKNRPTGMSCKNQPMRYIEEINIFYKNLPSVYNPIMENREGNGKSCYNYAHYCGDSNHVKMGKVKKHYDPNFVNPSDLLLFNTVPNRSKRYHPTQKPLNLLKYFILTYTNEGDIVFDGFMGSGSTGVAAIELNRKFIGCELNLDFFNTSTYRINEVTNV